MTLAKMQVWLCHTIPATDTEAEKVVKERLLHEAFGPTAEKQCEDFVAMWSPDKPTQPPATCLADGKKLTIPKDHEKLMFS